MIPVAFDLRDPKRSGIARVATATLEAFLRHALDGFRVIAAGPPATLEELGVRDSADVRVVPFGPGRYSARAEIEWPRVASEAGDAVWFFPHFDVPWRMGRLAYVAVIHDVAHFEGPGAGLVRGFVARRWIARTLGRAARVHTPSAFTAGRLGTLWPEVAAKISVVPNGVDDFFFDSATDPLPAPLLAWLDHKPFVLSVGNRKRHKNLAVGVEVLRQHPGLRWVVIGEYFRDWDAVEALARNAGVMDRIYVSSRESDATLRALYHASACLLFPSEYEGFGLPVLEAMACGTPVVASARTSVPEVLGDCGWLCDPLDAGQFSRAVGEALSLGAERARRGDRARARARTFTWRRAAEAFAEAARSIHSART